MSFKNVWKKIDKIKKISPPLATPRKFVAPLRELAKICRPPFLRRQISLAPLLFPAPTPELMRLPLSHSIIYGKVDYLWDGAHHTGGGGGEKFWRRHEGEGGDNLWTSRQGGEIFGQAAKGGGAKNFGLGQYFFKFLKPDFLCFGMFWALKILYASRRGGGKNHISSHEYLTGNTWNHTSHIWYPCLNVHLLNPLLYSLLTSHHLSSLHLTPRQTPFCFTLSPHNVWMVAF